jgi:hypothetical protein
MIEALAPGQTYWTPFDPGGPAKTGGVECGLHCDKQTVIVRHIEDH